MSRKLWELEPDEILAEQERRGDAYVLALDAEMRAEASHKRLEAGIYKALRAEGLSIRDAEMSTREREEHAESLADLISKQIAAQRARLDLDRAKDARSLYQTVCADRRKI